MSVAVERDLGELTTAELLGLFTTLDCPSVEEMHGDYQARVLRQPSWLLGAAGAVTLANPAARWLSKGFRPVDASTGRGYNSFSLLGRTVRTFPMATRIAPSRFDGLPAYELVYRAYRSPLGAANMIDEVRRIDEDRYLGLGTCSLTRGTGRVPLPFLLEGPTEPYLGDVGPS